MNEYCLSLDGIYHFPEIIYDDLTNNYTKYLNFINSNRAAKKMFIRLCKDFDSFLNRNDNNLLPYINKFNNKIYFYQHGEIIQTGGVNPLSVICSIFGSTIITASISYFVYKWFTRPICKPSYPLFSGKDVTIKDVLLQLIPKSFIPDHESLNSDAFIKKLNDKLYMLSIPFNVLDAKTLLKQVGVSIFRVATSLVADVATAGADGEILVDIVFDVKSVLDVIKAIVQGLSEIADDKEALRLLHDIFSINFNDGPFDVKCWIEYILKSYGKKSRTYQVVCSFFDGLADELATFVGNIVATTIPDSLGLPAIFSNVIMTHIKKHAYDYAIKFVDSKYNKIPYDKQILIRHPELMKQYLQSKLKRVHILFIGKYGKKAYDAILDNSKFFAVTINKLFALIYATLYALQECSISAPTGVSRLKRKSKNNTNINN